MVERVTIRRRDANEPPIVDYAPAQRAQIPWRLIAQLVIVSVIGAILGAGVGWGYRSTVRFSSVAYLQLDVPISNPTAVRQAIATATASQVHDQILSRVRQDQSISPNVQAKIPDVAVSPVPATKLVQFVSSGTDPTIACDAANELAGAYAKFLTNAGTPASVPILADRSRQAPLAPFLFGGALAGSVLASMVYLVFWLLRRRRSRAL